MKKIFAGVLALAIALTMGVLVPVAANATDEANIFAVGVTPPSIVGGKNCAKSKEDISGLGPVTYTDGANHTDTVALYSVETQQTAYVATVTVVPKMTMYYAIWDTTPTVLPVRTTHLSFSIPRCANVPAVAVPVKPTAPAPAVVKPAAPVAVPVKPVVPVAVPVSAKLDELAYTGTTRDTTGFLFAGVLAVALGLGALIWVRKTR
jgi:hypothetical protein